MDSDTAWDVLERAAADELVSFMAQRSAQPARKTRRRVPVDEDQLLEAARAVLRELHGSGKRIEGFPADADEASREELLAVAREAKAQALEEWWQKIGSPTLTQPERRRQMWWFVQERVSGELVPAP
jgi:hypothetical protein